MRMPRMQVYLPEDLYERVKAEKLPASELLQAAVRAELRRRELEHEADLYFAELVAEVGEPTPEQDASARASADRIREHMTRHGRIQ